MINLTAGYTMKMNRSTKLTVFLQGKNLMNEDVRLHTSYLKDFAPRPGRALLIGVRGQF
jgi:iron complex outermembrane receptor protein